MKGHGAALSTNHFSVASIPELSNNLTSIQKRLFNKMWNSYVASGNPFPLTSLPRIIGKKSVKEAFKGLNGSLIYETKEQAEVTNSVFKLTVYGAFLTVHGPALASLLVRLLDLVKELYDFKKLNKDQIKDRLGLSDADTQLLFRLFTLGLPPDMPINLSNHFPDGHEWTVSITDDVIGLFNSDDSVAYLDDRLSAGYRPGKPYSYDELLTYHQSQRQSGVLPNLNHDNIIKDIKKERGCRRLIRDNWPNIKSQHGKDADAHQVLRVLRQIKGEDEKLPALKTVQNCLCTLRNDKLIP